MVITKILNMKYIVIFCFLLNQKSAFSQKLTLDLRYSTISVNKKTESFINRSTFQTKKRWVFDNNFTYRPKVKQIINTFSFGREIEIRNYFKLTPYVGYRLENKKEYPTQHSFIFGSKVRLQYKFLYFVIRRAQLNFDQDISIDVRSQVYIRSSRYQIGMLYDMQRSNEVYQILTGPIIGFKPNKNSDWWFQFGFLKNNNNQTGLIIRSLSNY